LIQERRGISWVLEWGHMLKRVAEVWERWRKCASWNCSNDVLQLLRISKSKKTWDGELHTLFVLGRIPQILQPWYHRSLFSLYLCLSLSLSLSFSLSFPLSLILLGLADGFPHAHVPRGRSGEIMNETKTGKGETECVSRSSYSRFQLTLAQARAITSIIKGMDCRKFYYRY